MIKYLFQSRLTRIPADIGLLLFSTILVCLPHLLRLPIWTVILCVSVIGWRVLYELKQVPLPGKYLRLSILLGSLAGLFISYSTLIGRHAGSAMLVIMLCLKLLELNKKRDALVIIYISFFIIITGFLFDQSLYTGAYMVLVVWALITTMITYNHYATKGTSVQATIARHFKLAFILMAQAAPLMLLLFFLFPRLPNPLWGLPADAHGGQTGLSDTLEPGRISKLSDNPEVAFRVLFKGSPPAQNKLYWRGPVFTNYDGVRWQTDKNSLSLTRLDLDNQVVSNPVNYQLTLEPHNQRWLFALDIPTTVPERAILTNELQLLNSKPIRSVYRYSVSSALDYQYDMTSVLNIESALSLPTNTAPKTRQFVNKLRSKFKNDGVLVSAVLDHFRQQEFYYSRNPPRLYADHTDEFLFDTRKGYCEQYASAFAVMMRMARIPARIVTGYHGGEINPFSKNLIVRQSDAHSWVEIWLSKRGWLRIDPTSVIPDHRVENTTDLLQRQSREQQAKFLLEKGWASNSIRQLRFALDSIHSHWNSWIVGYDHQRQTNFFSLLGFSNFSMLHVGLLMAASISLAFFIIGLLLFRQRKTIDQPVLKAYEKFCKKLVRCGFEKKPYETATDFAQRVALKRQDLKQDVLHINSLYNQLRYASAPSRELLLNFKTLVQKFRPTQR
ncbi:MAG: DUF3488 and transglutaminase-like domain-containing protein [Gammaproteobacteria bacterium]|nr:DUF3488 and transglutaminase-like domain-containing protein [Gammaproteobacteria bacterium]